MAILTENARKASLIASQSPSPAGIVIREPTAGVRVENAPASETRPPLRRLTRVGDLEVDPQQADRKRRRIEAARVSAQPVRPHTRTIPTRQEKGKDVAAAQGTGEEQGPTSISQGLDAVWPMIEAISYSSDLQALSERPQEDIADQVTMLLGQIVQMGSFCLSGYRQSCQDINAAVKLADQLRVERDQKIDELAVANQSRNEAVAEAKKNQEAWAIADARASTMEAKNNDLMTRVGELNNEIARLKSQIVSLEEENEDLYNIDSLQELYNKSYNQGKKDGLAEAAARSRESLIPAMQSLIELHPDTAGQQLNEENKPNKSAQGEENLAEQTVNPSVPPANEIIEIEADEQERVVETPADVAKTIPGDSYSANV